MNLSLRHLFFSAFILAIGWGCSTTEKTSSGDQPITVESDTANLEEDLTELQTTLASNRSKLSDVYNSSKHDMPDAFLKSDSSRSLTGDPTNGYRIQIISTRDQSLADSMATKFRAWADSTIKGYTADSYIFFRQPFYKVHVGDFQQREQANQFSRLVKSKYPDAWVVHDRIKPKNVPADTTSFSLKKNKDKKQNQD